MVNKERVLAEFFELVSIRCSTRAEREVVDVVKAKLAAVGLTVDEDDVGGRIGGNCGNVIAYLKGNVATAPVLMLSAHLDCVEPCAGIKPQLKDGVITSGGDTVLGADDKSGVAGILEALKVIRETGAAHGDIQVVFTVAEEGGLNGSKNMDRSRMMADLGYVLDSGGAPGRIINAAPGQDSIKVIIRGKTAHAGVAPEEGINAIACGARSRDKAKLAAQTRHMVDTFEQVAAANGAKAEVTVKTAYDPYVLTADMPVVALARQAAESIGLTPVLEATGGGSDANFFNAFGVPSAVLGTGMSKVHTNAEFIKEEDLYKTAELVVAIIKEAAKAKKQ